VEDATYEVAEARTAGRMENVTLRDVSAATGATGTGVLDARVAGVSIDSRTTEPGDVFFAIRGERLDGHRFVADALDRGAVGAVVARDSDAGDERAVVLTVGDTTRALQDLASWYRGRFDLHVVGVTGTNGKTTTKDMTAAVLSTHMRTARTEGNLNNHIGVPLTLFGLTSEHRAAVVEMGMNHPGEIRRLAEIARPSVGVITNVAEGHLESMRTLDAVAEAKGELLEALPADGLAVLNADDDRVMAQSKRTSAGVVTFGLADGADVRASGIAECSLDAAGVTFELDGDGLVTLPVPGRHNVRNALAALAVGRALGVPYEQAVEGLRRFEPSPMRMRVSRVGRWVVLNDAYNSNPGSLAAALDTLAAMAGGRTTVAALGDMLELGHGSARAHREAGAHAASLGFNYLLLFGMEVGNLREGALEGGMPPEKVKVFGEKEALVRELRELPVEEGVLLVKGSRGMRMEEVVESLVRGAPAS